VFFETLCIPFTVIILPQKTLRYYARLNESFGQAKGAKPGGVSLAFQNQKLTPKAETPLVKRGGISLCSLRNTLYSLCGYYFTAKD
jgi:hypothetical protein